MPFDITNHFQIFLNIPTHQKRNSFICNWYLFVDKHIQPFYLFVNCARAWVFKPKYYSYNIHTISRHNMFCNIFLSPETVFSCVFSDWFIAVRFGTYFKCSLHFHYINALVQKAKCTAIITVVIESKKMHLQMIHKN